MIQDSGHKYIAQIARSGRISLRVTIDRKKSRTIRQIISTCPPRIGIPGGDRRQSWQGVRGIADATCKRHMIIWCADANGQLGGEEDAADQNTNPDNAVEKIIGPTQEQQRQKTHWGETEENTAQTPHGPEGDIETTYPIQSYRMEKPQKCENRANEACWGQVQMPNNMDNARWNVARPN